MTSPAAPRETAEDIDRAASDWVVREDRRPLTPDEQARLDAWLSADPRREGAYIRAHAAWSMLDRSRALSDQAGPPAPRRWPLVTRRELMAAGAAGVAVVGGGIAVWQAGRDRYATAVGEIRQVPLRDGSSIAINTASRVEASIGKTSRLIRLDKGEAWFDVAKDRARPFVVAAGDVRVRAVGTAFSVRRYDHGADVIVTEGVVEAWTTDAGGARKLRIAAGCQAFVSDIATTAAAAPKALPPSTVHRLLAWRDGMVGLDGETLAEAAAEFNRYNTRQIVVDDPELAKARLVGFFRATDPDSFVKAAVQTLGAAADIDDHQLRLSRAAAPA